MTLLNALSETEQQILDEAKKAGHTFDLEGQDFEMHVVALDPANKDGRQIAHGDVLLEMIDESEMPSMSNLTLQKPEGGHFIVAHSESGHHHVVDGTSEEVLEKAKKAKKGVKGLLPQVKFWGTNRFEESYMKLDKATPIRHLKPDVSSRHRTVVLPAGYYRIRRGTETLRGRRQAVQD